MKQVMALAVLLAVAGTALYLAEHRKHPDQVSANAVVDLAADWQHDVSRVPMRLSRISDNEEMSIGDRLAATYQDSDNPSTAEDRATEKYINEVGSRVAAHAKRRLRYHFHLTTDRDLINAFALPGGHVFVGRGLLDRMTSEDELAFVLGHEIEHIDHYHAVERVQIEARLRKMNLDIVGQIAQIPVSLWQEGYSKDEEFEADREGLRIASAAGYSPQGALNLLQRFARMRQEYVIHAQTPTEELSQLAVEGLQGYFRSHPFPSERLSQAQAVIAEDRMPLERKLKPFRVEYEITASDK